MKIVFRKYKASALQFAILVSVIVAILLAAFLLFTFTSSSFTVKSHEVLSNIDISSKGIQYLQHDGYDIEDSLVVSIEETPVVLSNTYWGSFALASATAGRDKNKFKKLALLGSGREGEVTGMYLQDNSLPLVLAGKTRIEGAVFSPGNIIKPGNISGNYFNGGKLVNGSRYNSKSFLPALDPKWKDYVLEMQAFSPSPKDLVSEPGSMKNSFFGERKVIYNTEKIILDHQVLGHVIVSSETEIEISSFSELDQVLIIAPKVVVNSNFTGSLHIISEEVKVGENTKLEYPSSITVIQKPPFGKEIPYGEEPKIFIGNKSIVRGNIIYLTTEEEDKSRNHVIISNDAVVEGNVYSEGYTELKGTVIGSVYTKYFVANEGGSIYINHIYNGKILTEEVKVEMAGLPFEGKSKTIAAWLY